MHRFKKVFLVAIMAACLVACSGKPKGMDDNTYELGVKALQIMDDYNGAELTEDEAYEKLQAIYDRVHGREYSDDEFSQELQNGLVETAILSYQITMSSNGDLVEKADNLREILNKK